MADAKVSELAAATLAAASDLLLLIQSGASKQITIAELFAGINTPVTLQDTISIQGSETITSTGDVSVTENITYVEDPDASGGLDIVNGLIDGQVKIILMTSNVGGQTVTLSGTNVDGTIAFASEGDSGTFIYTSSKWYMIGGTATKF